MMTLPHLSSIRGFARRIRNRWRHAATVLLYHRVAMLDCDPQLLAVSPAHFDQHMATLRRIAHPMSLSSMIRAMADDTLPRRAVVVTFDDGYADNLTEAAPILTRHGIPATCFVAGSAIDSTTEFYWDELEAIFLRAGTLPERLELSIGPVRFTQSFGEFAVYSAKDAEQNRAWSLELPDATPRHQAYRLLCDLLRSVTLERREALLQSLRLWANRPATARPTHRTMTRNELLTFAQNPLIKIGAHTAHHAMLSSLSAAEQVHEIRSGRKTLEDVLRHEVNTFSYPYGSRRAYDTDTTEIVREMALDGACSNFAGRADAQTDPFQIPRVLVRDWDGAQFERQLREWFDE